VVFEAPTGLKTVVLVVTDTEGDNDSCPADVQVQDTLAPFIQAPDDITAECTSPAGTPVDLGTPIVSDECDAAPSVSNDAPALFPLGTTTVNWLATDADGNQGQDLQSVLVEDTTPPQAFCNSPATITPPDAPIAFTATASDTCGTATVIVTGYDCYMVNPAGKRVNKKLSCVVSAAGDTITVYDSGGVADRITWTIVATDTSGNTSSTACEVTVVNPAQ